MPKSFSDREKAYIRERLICEAEECLAVFGIRKTTVNELVRRVGIPKGTFYLFYESKEALVFDVILKLNTDIQSKLIDSVTDMAKKPDAEQLTDIVLGLYHSLDGTFMLKLIESGELEFYMQKAPPEFMEMNALDDEMMVRRLMALFPEMDAEKSALYSAALRGAFLLLLHKKELAFERFDEMLHLIVRGVIMQMFGE